MIRDAQARELDAIRELLSRANDTPHDLARVAAEKCFGDGMAGAPIARIHGDYDGIAVTCGRFLRLLAVDRTKRGRGIGTALLSDAESRGARIVGAEAGNYFVPGAPEEVTGFFTRRGYRETTRTQNLVAPTSFDAPPDIRRATHEERECVLDFIGAHFGATWRFEAARAFDVALPTMLLAEENGEIAGFAAHEANNRGLGTFGPTGVVKAFRRRGIGRRLLLASLADLRRLGYERAVIPWTDALEFYRASCGAEVEARFVTLASGARSAQS